MEAIKTIIASMQSSINEINAEVTTAETKGFVYARSKEIRKSAQALKVASQELRNASTTALKAAKAAKTV